MQVKKITFFFLLLLLPVLSFATDYSFADSLQWQGVVAFNTDRGVVLHRLSFRDAFFRSPEGLPQYRKTIPLHASRVKIGVALSGKKIVPVQPD